MIMSFLLVVHDKDKKVSIPSICNSAFEIHIDLFQGEEYSAELHIGKIYSDYRIIDNSNNQVTMIYGRYFLNEGCSLLSSTEKILENIHGSWLIIRQKKGNLIEIITDPGTSVPVYHIHKPFVDFYSDRLDFIAFCSGITLSVNWNHIFAFILNGNVVGDLSIFNEIDVLFPYSFYSIGGVGKINIKSYFEDVLFKDDNPKIVDDSINAYIDTCKYPYNSKLNFILSLTGGYDSRVTFAATYSSVRKKLKTSTFGLSSHKDVIVSRNISDRLKIPFIHIPNEEIESIIKDQDVISQIDRISLLTGGLTRHSYLFSYFYHRALEKYGFQGEINSHGGELVKGTYYRSLTYTKGVKRFYLRINKRLLKRVSNKFYGPARSAIINLDKYIIEGSSPDNTGYSDYELVDWSNLYNRFSRTWGSRHYSQMSDFFTYFPYMDMHFLRIAMRLPYEVKKNSRFSKYVPEKLVPEISDIKYGRVKPNYNYSRLSPLIDFGIRGLRFAKRKFFPTIKSSFPPADIRLIIPFVEKNMQDVTVDAKKLFPESLNLVNIKRLKTDSDIARPKIYFRFYTVLRYLLGLANNGVRIEE